MSEMRNFKRLPVIPALQTVTGITLFLVQPMVSLLIRTAQNSLPPLLSVYYKESNFKVSGNQDINVYNLSISIPDIVRSFVQEGVDVMDAHLCEDTLEDYFKKVTGGEGIA